ncbi:MAG: hypothetical protein M1596_06720 [Firmicutes bacterium]|jgi:hypothetical protein|nr:hypothetical protein [Bacillota bacterium]MCL5971827.1 hypothetical protein [Bacillota bacterium]
MIEYEDKPLEIAEIYLATKRLLERTEVPAIHQCLRIAVNNLHWALWLTGQESDFVPPYFSTPPLDTERGSL